MRARCVLLVGVAALLTLAPAADAARRVPSKFTVAPKPLDYTKLDGLSRPSFGDVRRTTVALRVADGTRLHLEIVKPHGSKQLGVIVEASPYHGTLYDRTGDRMIPLPGADGKLTGLSGFFPKRGYAVVFMDMRGTGLSSGCLNTLGPADQSDLHDVVEWAASQPWSNGRVGMIGHSYVGSTPIMATVRKPKGLVTIVPSAGLPAMYDHQWQLGVPYNAQYLGPIEAYQQLALQRELPLAPDRAAARRRRQRRALRQGPRADRLRPDGHVAVERRAAVGRRHGVASPP